MQLHTDCSEVLMWLREGTLIVPFYVDLQEFAPTRGPPPGKVQATP